MNSSCFRVVFEVLVDVVVRVRVAIGRSVSSRTVAAVLVLLAGMVIWRSCRAPSGRVSLTPYEEVGRVMARQTAKVLNSSGKVVVWRLQFGDTKFPMIVAAERAFDQTLRKTPGIVVVAREEDKYDPMDAASLSQTAIGPGKFRQFLEKYPNADALVLFGAAPQLTARDCDQLPSKRPKIVAAAIMQQRPDHVVVEKQVVQVLIESRVQVDLKSPLPKTPAEWFARRYVVLTGPAPGGTL